MTISSQSFAKSLSTLENITKKLNDSIVAEIGPGGLGTEERPVRPSRRDNSANRREPNSDDPRRRRVRQKNGDELLRSLWPILYGQVMAPSDGDRYQSQNFQPSPNIDIYLSHLNKSFGFQESRALEYIAQKSGVFFYKASVNPTSASVVAPNPAAATNTTGTSSSGSATSPMPKLNAPPSGQAISSGQKLQSAFSQLHTAEGRDAIRQHAVNNNLLYNEDKDLFHVNADPKQDHVTYSGAAANAGALAQAGFLRRFESPNSLKFDNAAHRQEWLDAHQLENERQANVIRTNDGYAVVKVAHPSDSKQNLLFAYNPHARSWVPVSGVLNSPLSAKRGGNGTTIKHWGDPSQGGEYIQHVANTLNTMLGHGDKFNDYNTLTPNLANRRTREALYSGMPGENSKHDAAMRVRQAQFGQDVADHAGEAWDALRRKGGDASSGVAIDPDESESPIAATAAVSPASSLSTPSSGADPLATQTGSVVQPSPTSAATAPSPKSALQQVQEQIAADPGRAAQKLLDNMLNRTASRANTSVDTQPQHIDVEKLLNQHEQSVNQELRAKYPDPASNFENYMNDRKQSNAERRQLRKYFGLLNGFLDNEAFSPPDRAQYANKISQAMSEKDSIARIEKLDKIGEELQRAISARRTTTPSPPQPPARLGLNDLFQATPENLNQAKNLLSNLSLQSGSGRVSPNEMNFALQLLQNGSAKTIADAFGQLNQRRQRPLHSVRDLFNRSLSDQHLQDKEIASILGRMYGYGSAQSLERINKAIR